MMATEGLDDNAGARGTTAAMVNKLYLGIGRAFFDFEEA